MLNRIIRIAAALACYSLIWGCSMQLDRPAEPEAIDFSAGQSLLRDDATKAGVDAIQVYGVRNDGEADETVFDHQTVELFSNGCFYSPVKSWNWFGTLYYDFLSIYPSDALSAWMNSAGNIAVSVRYSITGDDDLMAAGCRRRNNIFNPNQAVHFEFHHLTSAVQVVVRNSSADKSVTLDSWHFENLTVSADAKVTLDNFGVLSLSWVNTERNSSAVKETVVPADSRVIAAKGSYAGAPNLMIPQPLDKPVRLGGLEADMPKLCITYTPEGGTERTESISLKDIEMDSGAPIASWEMGCKYIYYVSMRLDGGVLVSLTTTKWDEEPYEVVEAQTPGLLI